MSETIDGAFLLNSRGIAQNLEAFVVGCAFNRAGTHAAFGLGDGTIRLAPLARDANWNNVTAHDGAVMSLSPDSGLDGFVSGGDDSRLVGLSSLGELREIAALGKWVEQTTSFWDGKSGVVAASAGRAVYLFGPGGERLKTMEHPSTVTGIAFDAKGKRIAASHYNGTSLWYVNSTSPTPRRLEWKGSHTAVALHPAAEAVVSAMQENALHGWRLPDGHDMRMSGYPAKPETLGFTRTGKWLASSGADAIVLWPFFGGGPMGKPPLELAQIENVTCTRIACHPTDDVVAAGYADGTVAIAEIASKRVLRVAPPANGAISALAWSPSGAWLGFGTETGFAALVDFTSK